MAITVDAGDGRIIEFPDVETANKFFASQAQEKPAQEPGRSLSETLYENIVGSGEVDTPGERLGQLIRGAGAATARGIADVPALPANLLQLGAMGVEKLAGMEQPSAVSRALESLPETRDILSALTGGESEYVAPGTAGQYISTIGEFAGGAGAAAGPRAMMRYGVVPGVASEAAGQATEGTAAEPFARAAAALAAPVVAGAAQRAVQGVVSPSAGQITPARQQAIETLRAEGVRPTAGQMVGGTAAEQQLYREALTAAGRAKSEKALGDFTAAVMKRIGSEATRATPDALEEASKRIGGVFDDVVRDVSTVPTRSHTGKMAQAIETYQQLAPKEAAAPIFKNVQKALTNSAIQNKPIEANTLKTWRSTLSKLTTSPDAATREAAIQSVDAIDDVINDALVAAGKPEAVKALTEARGQYRNLLAIERAASRADIEGILSPAQLRTALLQQSRRKYVQGKGDLAELTRAAADVLKPLPQSGTQPRTVAGELVSGATGGTGAGLGAFGLGADPATATIIGALATATPAVRNRLLASEAGQRYFANQLMREAGPVLDERVIGLLPGLLSQ